MNLDKKEEHNSCELLRPSGDDLLHHSQDNCNTSLPKCQLDQEIEEKWNPKKLACEPLVLSYYRLGYDDKACHVSECGSFLEFAKTSESVRKELPAGAPSGSAPELLTSEAFKLRKANFCRDRLCPMCSWRRSYKIFGQVSRIMNVIGSEYSFIFVTLTVPNCSPDELISTLDKLSKGWDKFSRYKRIKSVIKGYFKALEITYNIRSDSFHPHFHIVFAVPKDYVHLRDYIKRDEWLFFWQKAMNDFSITQVDVRMAKDKKRNSKGVEAKKVLASAVAEIAKYAVKSGDYLFDNDFLTDHVVSYLVPALADRRLCSFGGVFKNVAHDLNLDDAENGDLVHLDPELRSDVAIQIYRYGWSCGAYKLIEIKDNYIE